LKGVVPLLLSLNPSAVELLDATLLAFMGPDALPPPQGTACLLLIEFERELASAAHAVVQNAVRGIQHESGVLEVRTAMDRHGLDELWAVRRRASSSLARLPESRRSLQVIEDGCVPLEVLSDYIAGLRAAATARGIPVALFGHAGDGHVHVNVLPDLTRTGWRDDVAGLYEDTVTLLQRLGGTPSGEHGDGRLRAGLLERIFGPEVMRVFTRVKRTCDPLTILNPGVIIPAAGWAPLTDLKVGLDAAPIPEDIARRLRDVERTGSWSVPKFELARSP
jgi:FAD/FMN-containing dehydrogenase